LCASANILCGSHTRLCWQAEGAFAEAMTRLMFSPERGWGRFLKE